MPLEDRAADTWEPRIIVADLAGHTWPETARQAAVTLTADHDQAASVSDRIRLLTDCRTAFGDAEALPTAVLLSRLCSDPEAPWSDDGPGRLTANKLGGMLADYDIRSENIRFAEPTGRKKGYYRAEFTDAWIRYCPPPQRCRTGRTGRTRKTLCPAQRPNQPGTAPIPGTAPAVPARPAVPAQNLA
jgi:hypothetical protein